MVKQQKLAIWFRSTTLHVADCETWLNERNIKSILCFAINAPTIKPSYIERPVGKLMDIKTNKSYPPLIVIYTYHKYNRVGM